MGYSIELKKLSLKVSKVLLLNYRLYVLWKNSTKENKKLFEKQRNRFSFQIYFVGAILIDLLKAFNCIPHDLVIAKLAAYGFDKNMIRYIYSYLKSRKQCVSVKTSKVLSKK